MAKKKPKPAPAEPAEEIAVIYVEVPLALKKLMSRLAREHNRKLTGEVITALQRYLAEHKLWPTPSDPGE